jgi:pimeloyl-ACP methyl ester carboxylesterase
MTSKFPLTLAMAMSALMAMAPRLVVAAPQPGVETYQDIRVEIRGHGHPILMIPGLNSGAATWTETCDALITSDQQCLIVQLPGFAGQKPIQSDDYLETMRDRLLDYLGAQNLTGVTILGHSLGGNLALMMALKDQSRIKNLVIVDSLPFYPAGQNPAATPQSVKAQADAQLLRMRAPVSDEMKPMMLAMLQAMTLSDARVVQMQQWSAASDRATTAQAYYELQIIDLRDELGRITIPVLVLASWAGYAPYGATMDKVRQNFMAQYKKLAGVRIALSEKGRHFLMWDDPTWLQTEVTRFIGDQ